MLRSYRGKKLINAVKRLAGFIKAHHTDTSEKQRDKISSMVEKQKAAKLWTAAVEAEFATFNSHTETVRTELTGQRERQQETTTAALEGSTADQIASERIMLFGGPKAGRKLYCRIDRENGVLNTTYRMYLEAVRPIGNPDDEILDSREEFMFAARKLKSSYNANYHIYDTSDLSGAYCGKVRSAKRGIGASFAAGKQYLIYMPVRLPTKRRPQRAAWAGAHRLLVLLPANLLAPWARLCLEPRRINRRAAKATTMVEEKKSVAARSVLRTT